MPGDLWYIFTKINEIINGAAPFFSEITTARGAKTNLNARLDEMDEAIIAASGANTFLELTDVTPASYEGQAGKIPAVNTAETGLEFITVSSSNTDGSIWGGM